MNTPAVRARGGSHREKVSQSCFEANMPIQKPIMVTLTSSCETKSAARLSTVKQQLDQVIVLDSAAGSTSIDRISNRLVIAYRGKKILPQRLSRSCSGSHHVV